MATDPKLIRRKQKAAVEALRERICYLVANQMLTPDLLKPAINLCCYLGVSLGEIQSCFDSVYTEIVEHCEGSPC